MTQISFASMPIKAIKIRAQKFLEEMEQIVPWQELLKIIEPHYPKAGKGRRPMNLHMMKNLLSSTVV